MPPRSLHRAFGALFCVAALAGCGGGGTDAPVETATAAATGTPSNAEVGGLRFMREEEKLAHDVYAAMDGLWGQRIFANIGDSESAHTAAILTLLVTHGIADPAAGRAPGDFEDASLQSLHDLLLASGSRSLIDALKVGALIEETDIRDIEQRKLDTTSVDILRVYDNLLCGSRNHLRAFDQRLGAEGVSYAAQVIGQDAWQAIASSPHESCGP